MLSYTISLCHVREIHISSYETRYKARSYLKTDLEHLQLVTHWFTGLMRERLSEDLTRLLPLLSEHSPESARALCYSPFCWPLVQKSKLKKAALFKCRGQVQKINGELSNKRTGLITVLSTLYFKSLPSCTLSRRHLSNSSSSTVCTLFIPRHVSRRSLTISFFEKVLSHAKSALLKRHSGVILWFLFLRQFWKKVLMKHKFYRN